MNILASPLALFSPKVPQAGYGYEPIAEESKAEGSRRRGSVPEKKVKRVEVRIGGMTVSLESRVCIGFHLHETSFCRLVRS